MCWTVRLMITACLFIKYNLCVCGKCCFSIVQAELL